MKKLLPILVLAFTLPACAAPDRSRRVLDDEGYTDIEIKGWKVFACGEDDTFSTGFRAKNVKGKMIDGVVCCGMLAKDCTVRH